MDNDFEELFVHVRDINEFKNPVSIVPHVEIREYDGIRCFVECNKPMKEKKLPNDFYLMEFMDLDASDEDALLQFQNKWGYIESVIYPRKKKREDFDFLNVLDFELLEEYGHDGFSDEYRFIPLSEQIRNSAYEIRFDNDSNNLSIITETFERNRAVCIEEAMACAKNTQIFIKAIVDGRMDGIIDAIGNRHFELVSSGVRVLSSTVDRCFPPIGLFDEQDFAKRSTRFSLLPLVYAQCLFGIHEHQLGIQEQQQKGYPQKGHHKIRQCQYSKCGRVFQLGRRDCVDGEYLPRRKNADYCSAVCQDLNGKHKVDDDGNRIY